MRFVNHRIPGALGAVVAALLPVMPCHAQNIDFAARQKEIKERVAKRNGRPQNKAVHAPPMIKPEASDLADNEPVIGVYRNMEARAYPLTMLFGGGGIFELLNDTCGGEAIAASW